MQLYKEMGTNDKENRLDKFIEKFRNDYTSGNIDLPQYEKYFAWKFKKAPLPNFHDVVMMAEHVSDDITKYETLYPNAASYTEPYINGAPWQNYKPYGKDKYIVSYLSYMENELLNLQVSGFLSMV